MEHPEKRFDEAFTFRQLLGEDATAFLATSRVRMEGLVVWEADQFHLAVVAMIDEVHKVDVDLAQSLQLR